MESIESDDLNIALYSKKKLHKIIFAAFFDLLFRDLIYQKLFTNNISRYNGQKVGCIIYKRLINRI